MKADIALCFDENYARHAAATMASILHNASDRDGIFFHIITEGLSEETKRKLLDTCFKFGSPQVEFVVPNEDLLRIFEDIKTHSYLSRATFFRLNLASFLPDTEKLVYLDCDTIVLGDISELISTQMHGLPLAGVEDIAAKRMKKRDGLDPKTTYINAGMFVMDCVLVRQQGIERAFAQYAAENAAKIRLGDQQIINAVLQNNILALPPEWNVQVSSFVGRSDFTANPKLIHYIARSKPWIFGSWTHFREEYFKYAQMTSWKEPQEEFNRRRKASDRAAIWGYIKYRPFTFLRPKFYMALYKTFIARKKADH